MKAEQDQVKPQNGVDLTLMEIEAARKMK